MNALLDTFAHLHKKIFTSCSGEITSHKARRWISLSRKSFISSKTIACERMQSKISILFYLLAIIFFMSICAYRLDTLTRENDLDASNELNDPYLIHRLQGLLAEAASKSGYSGLKDFVRSDHFINRRFEIPRRPGLFRLK